jgi:hypothetical protein
VSAGWRGEGEGWQGVSLLPTAHHPCSRRDPQRARGGRGGGEPRPPHRDRVVPKQEFCEQVWSAQAASDATIENCLKAIRRAIGDNGQAQRLIETRYGQGYRFIAAVTMSPDSGAHGASEAVSSLPAHAAVACHDPPIALDALARRSPPFHSLQMTHVLLTSGKWLPSCVARW